METSAVSGMRVTIVSKKKNTLPPHLPSHSSHEVEVCRRNEVSKAQVTMVPFSDDRAENIWRVLARDRFVKIGILPSVNSTKQKRDAKPGICVCSCTTRLMNNQTKSQRKATIPQNRRESDDKNAVAIVKIVPQFGCVSQDADALVSQRGQQLRRNPMQKVLGSFRKVRFTESTLREKKGPALGKIQVKPQHQWSPYAVNCWGQVPWRDWKTRAMCPKARLGTLPKTKTSSKRTTKLHSTRLRNSGYSRLRQQKNRRKESLW